MTHIYFNTKIRVSFIYKILLTKLENRRLKMINKVDFKIEKEIQ